MVNFYVKRHKLSPNNDRKNILKIEEENKEIT